jgi:hypothetical protein
MNTNNYLLGLSQILPRTKLLGRRYKFKIRLGIVTHAYNPSYSEGREWEDHGLRLAKTKS